MTDIEPILRLKGDDGEYEAKPSNSALYRHLGDHALYDNVFLISGDSDEGREGAPVFLRGFVDEEMLNQITHFMITRGYECHVNLPEALPAFVKVHEKSIEHEIEDIGDTIPEEWGDGEA